LVLPKETNQTEIECMNIYDLHFFDLHDVHVTKRKEFNNSIRIQLKKNTHKFE